jgi:SSS family solute:Na+ symporter
MPVGIKGLVFAAVIAAIVSSLASMTNSIATIFTMDLYAFYRKDKAQTHYVSVGRAVSLTALILAMICAKPLLGNFDQAFQYIQEFTGFFTPGIVVLFLLGMFWKKATALSALVAALASAVLSLGFKLLLPEIPFMDRVGLVFLLCLLLAVVTVTLQKAGAQQNAVALEGMDFSTARNFNLSGFSVALILVGLYATWW